MEPKSADKVTIENASRVAVLYWLPWAGAASKCFAGGSDVEVGFALGYFLVDLYKRGGRALEIEMRRESGEEEFFSGLEFERKAGWKPSKRDPGYRGVS